MIVAKLGRVFPAAGATKGCVRTSKVATLTAKDARSPVGALTGPSPSREMFTLPAESGGLERKAMVPPPMAEVWPLPSEKKALFAVESVVVQSTTEALACATPATLAVDARACPDGELSKMVHKT